MSGGAFDYDQYRLGYIVDSIEDRIEKNTEKPEYWWGEWKGQVYSDATIEEFKNAVAHLKIALCYAQRVDWLLSGDDGEDSFHKRLKEELDELTTEKYGDVIGKILKKEE